MQQPGLGRGSCAPVMDTVSPVEVTTMVREDVTITEMAPPKALSWLKAPTSAFAFETLLFKTLC